MGKPNDRIIVTIKLTAKRENVGKVMSFMDDTVNMYKKVDDDMHMTSEQREAEYTRIDTDGTKLYKE